MNLFIKQSHRCGKQTYGFWDGGEEKGGEGINWEMRIDIYKLWCIKQRTNKDLVYSTWNTVMIYMGRESKRVDICI